MSESPPRSPSESAGRVPGVSSPCRRVCVMDPDSGLCRGCWRSLAEIAAWSTLDDTQRRQVLVQVDRRRAASRNPAHGPRT